MSESKGKNLFVILAILLLLFGGGTILYPSLNGLSVLTGRRDWNI